MQHGERDLEISNSAGNTSNSSAINLSQVKAAIASAVGLGLIVTLISLGLLFISLTPAWRWWGYFMGALVVPNSIFIALDTMLGVERKRVRYFLVVICLMVTCIGLGLSVSFKGI